MKADVIVECPVVCQVKELSPYLIVCTDLQHLQERRHVPIGSISY
jgi:hypothetical protein